MPSDSMKNLLILFFSCLCLSLTKAQTTVGLVAYYPFNSSYADVTGNTANAGVQSGDPSFACGISGGALFLDGIDDKVSYLGPLIQEFDTEDFTVSFYFKATITSATRYLLSKRSSDCKTENAFYIRYVPQTRTINCFLGEDQSKSVTFIQKLDDNACWYQLTLIRQGTKVSLHINGKLVRELFTNSRINILNDGPLVLGSSECRSSNETSFAGLIDEFRVYNRALTEKEARELYAAPDMIQNRDTLLFLGSSVQINVPTTCASSFSWEPLDGVVPPVVANPLITPTQAGSIVYKISFYDNISPCVATDTIRLNVVDPNSLDCNTIFLPKAFTPNGDGLNETFGISNPFAFQQLISFEIFDRWGGRVFATNDPFVQWDGAANGQAVNSGVMLYRIRYICQGEEKVVAGSVTIMR